MTEPQGIAIGKLIPHRPPMVMIESLVEASPERAVAAKTFRDGDYGLDGDMVAEPALVECVAQTVAAMQGYGRFAAGARPGIGFLAGVARFSIHFQPRRGEPLTIETQVTRRLGTMCLVTGKILREGRILAEGELRFSVP